MPGQRLRQHGVITRYHSPSDFDLNGFPVSTDANTDFVNGAVADLGASVEIIVDGEVTAAGETILAKEVTFTRRVRDRNDATSDD